MRAYEQREARRQRRWRAITHALGGAFVVVAALGCVLEDIQITDLDRVVVAEVLVQIRDDGVGGLRPGIFAMLQNSVGSVPAGDVRQQSVVIHTPRGSISLQRRVSVSECAAILPPHSFDGTCFRATPVQDTMVRLGDSLSVQIETGQGVLLGASVVPGSFDLLGVPASRTCVLPPDTTVALQWTRSVGAWGYVAETAIDNLYLQLPELWPTNETLHLSADAVSETDTRLVFPSEFGVRERFSADPGVLVRLQTGLPAGALAAISVGAADRNYFNWHRGAGFNPSGPIRVPSLRGSGGTGFFGAVVVRTMSVWSPPRAGWDAARESPCA